MLAAAAARPHPVKSPYQNEREQKRPTSVLCKGTYLPNNILLLQYIAIVKYVLQCILQRYYNIYCTCLHILQYILHLPPHIAITVGETSEKEVSKIVWKIS